jgi:mono/diheme cytochrome c family protein
MLVALVSGDAVQGCGEVVIMRLLRIVALALPVLSLQAASAGPPVAVGFERTRALGKPDGWLLVGELNCVSCHAILTDSLSRKQAPVLDHVGNRVRAGYLRRFLSDPQAVMPGTTMPGLFVNDSDRAEKVEALVQFLAGTGVPKQERPNNLAAAAGRELYRTIGCAACHGGRDTAGQPEKNLPSTAMPLGELTAKYTIPSLAAFLDNPLQVRPSGRMPHLVSGKAAKDIAQFLLQGLPFELPVGKGTMNYAYYEGDWSQTPDFTRLRARSRGVASAFDLSVARRESNFGLRFDGFFKVEQEGVYLFTVTSDDGSKLYVDGKEVVDNDGVHSATTVVGEVELSKGMHAVAVSFFQGGGEAVLNVQFEGPGFSRRAFGPVVAATAAGLEPRPEAAKKTANPDDLVVRPELVAKGRALFVSARCANCHELRDNGAPLAGLPAGPAIPANVSQTGCLAPAPARGLPWYDLDAEQRSAMVTALRQPIAFPMEPAAVVARTMATFNCYACHVRDKVGGPDETTSRYFVTTQPEMGEEARVPPPLDGVGAKLNGAYLKQILDQGAHDRPYMQTHMPGFGAANVGAVATALTALDHVPAAPAVHFEVAEAKVKSAGRFMVGAQAFGCISCHTFAGHKASGVQGIDMSLMTRRLSHDWFHLYLANPQRIRPGTRMPGAWMNGESPLKQVLDGQAATQIEAIWTYLLDGGKAQLPAGMGKQFIPLVPREGAILYRNFIQGAGPRAIGVGYPEKANLAFDANNMRLAMIWQGGFIDAGRHWTDRGEGFEGPLGDSVLHLPDGPSFALLEKADAPWPSRSPKELGWKFKGYRLTPDDRPTFKYALGDLEVEDFPNAVAGKSPSLTRTLKLSAVGPLDNLYFRAAMGAKIESLGAGWYGIDGWKMKIESATAPQVRQSNGKAELLVPIRFADTHAKVIQEFSW